jgi:SPP1 family predicted phage head-tail adaptor
MSGSGRPSRHRVGAMRHRCTIQQETTTQDASGQPIVSWSNYVVNEPCEWNPTSGIENMRGRQLEAGTRAVFIVRYRSGYNTQMSVLFENERYGITAINRVDGLRKYLEIICSAVL